MDPRDRKPVYDLYKVDYAWVEKQTSKKELKLAYKALDDDKGYPDLQAAVKKKLKQLDPSFKTAEDFNNYTPAEERAANDDVLAFLDEMNEADKKIRGDEAGPKRSKAIFDDDRGAPAEQTEEQKAFIASLENKRSAEDARYRGNEYMKAKEYDEAISAYTRAVELNESEPAAYCNRAMAYLRVKNYAKCIEDANKTLELEPDYVKAFHRRGKAYLACNKFELAIPDFQYILEKNPDDQDINACLMQAREKLRAKQEKAEAAQPKTVEIKEDEAPTPSTAKPAEPKKSGGFKKIQIEEEDDDEDEGEQASPSEDTKEAKSTADSSSSSGKGMKIEEISSTESQQSNWW